MHWSHQTQILNFLSEASDHQKTRIFYFQLIARNLIEVSYIFVQMCEREKKALLISVTNVNNTFAKQKIF